MDERREAERRRSEKPFLSPATPLRVYRNSTQKGYIIPLWWYRKWEQYLIDISIAKPTDIDTKFLLCEHGNLVCDFNDPHYFPLLVISEFKFNQMHNFGYNFSFPISITSCTGKFESEPYSCWRCKDQYPERLKNFPHSPQFNIKVTGHSNFDLKVDESDSVGAIKVKIYERLGLPANLQSLRFNGRTLTDNEILTSIRIYPEETVELEKVEFPAPIIQPIGGKSQQKAEIIVVNQAAGPPKKKFMSPVKTTSASQHKKTQAISTSSNGQSEIEAVYQFIEQLVNNDVLKETELEAKISESNFNLNFTEKDETNLARLIERTPLHFENSIELQTYVNEELKKKKEVFSNLKELQKTKAEIFKRVEKELREINQQYLQVESKIAKLEPIQKVLNPAVRQLSHSILPFKEKYSRSSQVDIMAMNEDDVFAFWSYAQLAYVGDINNRKIKGEHLEFITDPDLLHFFHIQSIKERKKILHRLDLLKYGQLFHYVDQNTPFTAEKKLFKKHRHKFLCSICRHDQMPSFSLLLKEHGIENLDQDIMNSLTSPEFVYVEITDFAQLKIPLLSRGTLIAALNVWKQTHNLAMRGGLL